MWGEGRQNNWGSLAEVHLIPFDRIDHYVTVNCWCSPVTFRERCYHRNMGSFESPYLAIDFTPHGEYSTRDFSSAGVV